MLKIGHTYCNKAKTVFGMKYPAKDIIGVCVACAPRHEKMFHREGVTHVPEGTEWGAYLEIQGRDRLYWVDSNDIVEEIL